MKANWLCLSLLTLLAVSEVRAQKTSVSPYSRYGLGLLREGKFIRNYGLAGAGIALNSDLNINPQNPASYYSWPLTSFEAGLEGNNTWLKSGDQEQYKSNAFFSHLLFGIPVISGKWGMAVCMMPISSVGYDYQQVYQVNDEVGTVTNLYEGSGGLNKIMMGHGFKLSKSFSLGFNASYIFGQLDFKERIIYNDQPTTFHTRKTDEWNFSDVYFDIGLQHKKIFKNELILTSGFTYALAQDVNAKRTSLVESYSGSVGFERIKDTVESVIGEKSTVKFPTMIGLGFALEKENRWTITTDLNYGGWADFSFNPPDAFSDAISVKSGMEVKRKETRKKNGRLRKLDLYYRFGGRYSTLPIRIYDEQVNEVAATFGLSLNGVSRVGSQRTIRGMNFGMEIGMRGEDAGELIGEQFVNFILAITINDKWFIKRKYD